MMGEIISKVLGNKKKTDTSSDIQWGQIVIWRIRTFRCAIIPIYSTITNPMLSSPLIILKYIVWPGAERTCFCIIRGWGIRIMPFWDMDCSCPCRGGGDMGGEGAVDEKFLFS
jgi:hypothetical protein